MDIQVIKKIIRIYSRGDEIVEVETTGDGTDFWYTRRGYGRKIFIFGIAPDIPFEELLEVAFKQGPEMWELMNSIITAI